MRGETQAIQIRRLRCAMVGGLGALMGFLLAAPVFAQDPAQRPEEVAETEITELLEDESDDLFDDEQWLDTEDLFDDEETERPLESNLESDLEGDLESADELAAEGEDTPAPDSAASPDRPASPSQGVEEIIVQGQAGTGIEADAAVSVTQFDSADLEALGVQDVSDVAQYTPNLEIRTAGSTAGTFFIRGVGLNDFTANAAGAIAIYQDEVPLDLPAIQLSQLFDVQNLEVLRGPQSAGPNRNASGGNIRIHSRKPAGEYAASLRASYGRFDERDFEGALELPLKGEELSTRVAFRLRQRDPLVHNRCGDAPPVGLARVFDPALRTQPRGVCGDNTQRTRVPNPGGQPPVYFVSAIPIGLETELSNLDNWAARVQLRYVPEQTDMEWLVNVHGGRIDQTPKVGQPIGTQGSIGGRAGFFGGATPGNYRAKEITAAERRIYAKFYQKLVGPLPPSGPIPEDPVARERARLELGRRLARNLDQKPFTGDYNRDGHETQTTYGGFVRGDFELDFARFVSITGAEYYERNRNVDADYTSENIFEFLIDDEAWQLTQDFRLEGELDAVPVEWELGIYYLMGRLDYDQQTVPTSNITTVNQIYEQRTWSLGPYVSFDWQFTDDFSLESGLRYNFERKTFDIELIRSGAPICERIPNPIGPDILPQDCSAERRWDALTGFVSLRYYFSDEVSVYAKYSRGWKSGQFSPGGASGNTLTIADPESLDAFELGLSGAWLDGRLAATGSLFYYNYEDYQVFLAANNADSPPQRIVTNASDAVLYGAELETVLEPLEGFVFTSRFGWIESEFLDFTQLVFRTIEQGLPLPPVILPVTIEWTGNRLPNTPRFKWSGSLEYALDLGRWGQLQPRWDFVWTDDASFDASNGRGAPLLGERPFMPKHAIGQQAFWLHNLRLAYQLPGGTTEVAFWIRNVADEVYKTLAFDASVGAGLVGNLVGDPRTYGVSVSFSW